MKPPKWSIQFLEWFCPEELREGILGDLLEQFEANQREMSARKARWIFVWNVLRLFHPAILFRNHFTVKIIHMGMLKSHLIVALRSMLKHKFYAIINLLGLSFAVAFIFLAYLFIQNELSYDRFHSQKSSIYRVYHNIINKETNQSEDRSAVTAVPLGKDLAEEFPAIIEFTRYASNSCIIQEGETPNREVMHFVDPGFLEIFDFPLLRGDKNTALDQPDAVIISREMARKYFGDQNPMGQSLKLTLNDTSLNIQISGVIDPKKAKSSLPFDFLMPIEQFKLVVSEKTYNSYHYGLLENYVLLEENAEKEAIEALMGEAINKHNTIPDKNKVEYGLQPLPDLHMEDEVVGNALYTSPQKLYILLAIAFLVLIVAGINFITLSTSQVLNRLREVGVRKTLGAQKGQLKRQFALESLLVTLFSGILGILIARLMLPTFEEIIGKSIPFEPDLTGVLLMLGLVLGIALATGWLKSTVLVRLTAMQALKGKMLLPRRNRWFNDGLVVVQFALSIILIIGAVNIRAQMRYMQEKDLGYQEERLLELSMGNVTDPERTKQIINRFRNRALKDSRILEVTASMNNSRDPWTSLVFDQDDGSKESIYYNQIDEFYLETMGIKLLKGRKFESGLPNPTQAILVNEALVEHFGWENPFGRQIPGSNFAESHHIIGVVRDFHFNSLHQKIEPLILALDLKSIGSGITGLSTYVWPANLYNLVVRLGPGELQPMLDHLKGVWKEVSPDKPFTFHFVDEVLDDKYAEERRWGKTTHWASLLAIFIAWLGLLGMMRLSIQKRTREIGIRKVLGATTPGVIRLLSSRFLLLVGLGILIAGPVAWLLLSNWLTSFSYRIELNPLLFLLIGLIVLLASLASVSLQSLRLARSNPVETLKVE